MAAEEAERMGAARRVRLLTPADIAAVQGTTVDKLMRSAFGRGLPWMRELGRSRRDWRVDERDFLAYIDALRGKRHVRLLGEGDGPVSVRLLAGGAEVHGAGVTDCSAAAAIVKATRAYADVLIPAVGVSVGLPMGGEG